MSWEAFLSGIEKILHWFSPRFMFFILILSAGLFFMPHRLACYLSMDDLISHHRGWLGFGMVISAVYLIPFRASPIVEKKFAKRRTWTRMEYVMTHLADDEKRLLSRFYFPRKIGHLIVWRHEIGKLEAEGVLFCPGDSGLTNKQDVYSLTREARDYIENHKEEFLAEITKFAN